MREYLKKALRASGYEVRRRKPNLEDFLSNRSIDAVIDVGANVGQFGSHLRQQGYSGAIYSFEPVKDCFAKLQQVSAGDDRWSCFNNGLASRSGTVSINVSEHSVFSSIRKIAPAATAYEKRANVVREEMISIEPLNTFANEIKGENLFLKIDTQGYEEDVLEGSSELLPRVQGMQLELPLSQLYEESWNIESALTFMRRLGFIPALFTPVNYHVKDPMAAVEVDCIFRKLNADLD